MAPTFARFMGRGTPPWYCLTGLGLAFCLMATGIFDRLCKIKYEVPNDSLDRFQGYEQDVAEALRQVDEANR